MPKELKPEMGTFRYAIEIGSADQSRFERLEPWVDSGSIYTWIPRSILDGLGFAPLYRRRFQLANGQIIERGVCQVPIRIGQETLITLCVFGDDDSEPLLGATALEDFSLGVDPVNRTLVPVPAKLLSFGPEALP